MVNKGKGIFGFINHNGTTTRRLTLRALTGFLLAGIYPVGMKIASDWHREGLGKAGTFLSAAR